MRDALTAALTAAAAEPGLRVVLAARARISARVAIWMSSEPARSGNRAPDPAHSQSRLLLHRLSARTTAHLHGACLGAGVELPAFASRVVAAEDTRLALPELTFGLIPGAGGQLA